jgi:hypothetical protein
MEEEVFLTNASYSPEPKGSSPKAPNWGLSGNWSEQNNQEHWHCPRTLDERKFLFSPTSGEGEAPSSKISFPGSPKNGGETEEEDLSQTGPRIKSNQTRPRIKNRIKHGPESKIESNTAPDQALKPLPPKRKGE